MVMMMMMMMNAHHALEYTTPNIVDFTPHIIMEKVHNWKGRKEGVWGWKIWLICQQNFSLRDVARPTVGTGLSCNRIL